MIVRISNIINKSFGYLKGGILVNNYKEATFCKNEQDALILFNKSKYNDGNHQAIITISLHTEYMEASMGIKSIGV